METNLSPAPKRSRRAGIRYAACLLGLYCGYLSYVAQTWSPPSAPGAAALDWEGEEWGRFVVEVHIDRPQRFLAGLGDRETPPSAWLGIQAWMESPDVGEEKWGGRIRTPKRPQSPRASAREPRGSGSQPPLATSAAPRRDGRSVQGDRSSGASARAQPDSYSGRSTTTWEDTRDYSIDTATTARAGWDIYNSDPQDTAQRLMTDESYRQHLQERVDRLSHSSERVERRVDAASRAIRSVLGDEDDKR